MVDTTAGMFGRRTQPGVILSVKRTQSGFNGLTNPNDTFFDGWTEEGNPKLTSVK